METNVLGLKYVLVYFKSFKLEHYDLVIVTFVICDHIDFPIRLFSSMISRHKYNSITSNVYLKCKQRVKIGFLMSISQNVLIFKLTELKSV